MPNYLIAFLAFLLVCQEDTKSKPCSKKDCSYKVDHVPPAKKMPIHKNKSSKRPGSGDGSCSKPPRPSHSQQITVTIAAYGPGGYPTLLSPLNLKILPNTTVLDASLRAFKAKNIAVEVATKGDDSYITSIAGLGQFFEGPESGWLYKVNGRFPSETANNYIVQAGDQIDWIYTINLGHDVRCDLLSQVKQNNYIP